MQRYISKELTHFVGRGLKTEEQFRILCEILSSGWLTHPPHNPRNSGNLIVKPESNLSTNEMYSPQMVCFCDIPVADFDLHMRKYSPFGIAFSKDFLINWGATPVWYIPRNAAVATSPESNPDIESDENYRRYFHSIFQSKKKADKFDTLSPQLMEYLDPGASGTHWRRVLELQRFAAFHIFSYLKFFNAFLPDDHEHNYYFEREWRTLNHVPFTLNDVVRVCLPSRYSEMFRQDVPDYYGQINFTDDFR